MQALLFMAIFSLFLSVVGGIVTQAAGSTAQLTRLRVAVTQEFFGAVEQVAQDVTRNGFQLAAPAQTDVLGLIRGRPDFAQLNSGPWGNPTLDAWGNEIQGLMARENRILYVNGTDMVMVPVTAVALLSAGPNREFETVLPATVTIAALQGIMAPLGSDDIVKVFTDETAQRRNWETIQARLDRIATAELRYYQAQVFLYQEQLMQNYLQQLQDESVGAAPDVAQVMNDDAGAPRFMDLNSDNNRRLLGVDDDFYHIERTLAGGGRLLVASTSNADGSLTLSLVNDPVSPSPWGGTSSTLSFNMTLKGTL